MTHVTRYSLAWPGHSTSPAFYRAASVWQTPVRLSSARPGSWLCTYTVGTKAVLGWACHVARARAGVAVRSGAARAPGWRGGVVRRGAARRGGGPAYSSGICRLKVQTICSLWPLVLRSAGAQPQPRPSGPAPGPQLLRRAGEERRARRGEARRRDAVSQQPWRQATRLVRSLAVTGWRDVFETALCHSVPFGMLNRSQPGRGLAGCRSARP